jgi:hypothetical protein
MSSFRSGGERLGEGLVEWGQCLRISIITSICYQTLTFIICFRSTAAVKRWVKGSWSGDNRFSGVQSTSFMGRRSAIWCAAITRVSSITPGSSNPYLLYLCYQALPCYSITLSSANHCLHCLVLFCLVLSLLSLVVHSRARFSFCQPLLALPLPLLSITRHLLLFIAHLAFAIKRSLFLGSFATLQTLTIFSFATMQMCTMCVPDRLGALCPATVSQFSATTTTVTVLTVVVCIATPLCEVISCCA